MNRIITEIYTQADTRQLERAAKLLDTYNDIAEKGGKASADAFKANLSVIDKLTIKLEELKRAQLAEKDEAKVLSYGRAIESVSNKLKSLTGQTQRNTKAAEELNRAERKQAGILEQLLDREARLVRLRNQSNDPNRIKRFNAELDKTRQKYRELTGQAKGGGGISGENKMAALLGSLGGGASGLASSLGGLAGGPIGAAVAGLTVDLGGALIETSKNALNAAAEMEGLKTQIETFAGVEVGTGIFRELEQFALKNPVANLQESLRGAAMLLQEGFGAEESVNIVKQLTDVTKGNTDQFQRMSRALAQVKGAGRLMGEELNQLRDAGFNPLTVISEKTGESMAKLKKRMEAGGISAKEVADALKTATSEGGRFYNMSENLSGTVTGNMAAIEDSTTKLSASFGNFVNRFGGAQFLGWLNKATLGLSAFFDSFNPKTLEGEIATAFDSLDNLNPRLGDISSIRKAAIKDFIAATKAGLSEEEALSRTRTKLSKQDIETAKNLYAQLAKEEADFQKTTVAARERFSGTGLSKLFDYLNKQEEVTKKGAKTLADIEADENARRSFLIDKKNDEELSKSETLELQKLILKKKKGAELSDAERKALKDINKAQKEADEERLKKVKETNEKLESLYKERNAKLLELQDKARLESISETNNEANIRERLTIERDAEIRQIEANKQDVNKSIEATTKEQQALKIKLLATFEKEKEAVTALYALRESKALEEHNKAIIAQREELNSKLFELRNSVAEAEFALMGESLANEIRISNERERIARESLERELANEIKSIEEQAKQGLILETEKNAALIEIDTRYKELILSSDNRFALDRLDIQSKYTQIYLDNIKAQQDRENAILDVQREYAKNELTKDYLNGIIGRKKYYKELEKLDRDQQLKAKGDQLGSIVSEQLIIRQTLTDSNSPDALPNQILSEKAKKELTDRLNELGLEYEKVSQDIQSTSNEFAVSDKEKRIEDIKQIADATVGLVNDTVSAINAITQAQIDSIDNLLNVQNSRVENARALAEAGYTSILQEEQDKMEKLQQRREELTRRQVILDNIARISAQALALANVIAGASESGPLAPILIPIAVGSFLASLATGLASARSYNEGTAFLKPNNATQGRRTDDIPIWANKGEGIIPTAQNAKFNDITKALIDGKPKSIADAVAQYPQIMQNLPDYSNSLRLASTQSDRADNLERYVKRLEKLVGEITIVNQNTGITFDERGVSKRQKVITDKLANLRNKV